MGAVAMRRRVLAQGVLLGLLALLLLLALREWTVDRAHEDLELPLAPESGRAVPSLSKKDEIPVLPPLLPDERPVPPDGPADDPPGSLRGKTDASTAAPRESEPVPTPPRAVEGFVTDPFSDDRTLGPPETIHFVRKLGPLALDRPHPRAHGNPFFWTAYDLEEGLDEHGRPRYVARLPVRGGWDFYVIWQLGELRIGLQADGLGARPFCLGRGEPALETVEVERKDGRTGEILRERYTFQTLELRSVATPGEAVTLPSDPGVLRIRVRAATYLEGPFRGGKVYLFDDSTNAAFMDEGDRNPRPGRSFDGEYDTVVYAGPSRTVSNVFGTLLQTDDAYFVVTEANEDEAWIRVREYKGPMGRISVRFRGTGGARLVHLVLGLKTGLGSGFVNLGETEGAVAVPAGRYTLVRGLAAIGGTGPDRRQVEIRPGGFEEIQANENRHATVHLGVRLEADLSLDVEGAMAELDPAGIEVKGLYGEEYVRFWGCPPILDYQVHDANGLLVKEGRFEMAGETPVGSPPREAIRNLLHPKSVVFTIPESARRPLRVSMRGVHPILGWIR